MKNPKPLLAALGLLVFAPSLNAQVNGPTPYPDAKDEAAWPGKGPIRSFGWMVDNRKYFWTQRTADQGKVVFVGDSLTAGWKQPVLVQAFPNLKIANRGVGGDTSRGVLFRFKEDVLDLHPKAILLLVGGNDLSAHGDTAAAAGNIEAMIEMAHAADPKVPIIVAQGPPSGDPKAPQKPGARADLNARIGKFADAKKNVTVVDLFTPLADAEGKPVPEYFAADLVHIGPAGYQKWVQVLVPLFEKLGIK